MWPTSSGDAFAAANAAMVRGVDSASTVHVLLADCLELLRADSAGVLVKVGEHGLERLAATSHQAVILELYQAQLRSGPCVESIESGVSITVSGADELAARWPQFGRAMAASGFVTVHAEPMLWRHRVLGGVNLFFTTPRVLTADEVQLATAFADICSLALMQASTTDPESISEHVRSALLGRVVIERAKGVLSQSHGLDMGEAFAELLLRSRQAGEPLAVVAERVIRDIVDRRPD